ALVAQAAAALDVVIPLRRRHGPHGMERQVAGIHVVTQHEGPSGPQLEVLPAVHFDTDRGWPDVGLAELKRRCQR
ncbi:hypothetical protein, partial [Bacillus cereus]|uniref:hypothetical protein n=1 Tax=Bacillus cereus TaxID=1396 RepID=UPI002111DB2B|nr:hypothetical protein [Bacillus cereus]